MEGVLPSTPEGGFLGSKCWTFIHRFVALGEAHLEGQGQWVAQQRARRAAGSRWRGGWGEADPLLAGGDHGGGRIFELVLAGDVEPGFAFEPPQLGRVVQQLGDAVDQGLAFAVADRHLDHHRVRQVGALGVVETIATLPTARMRSSDALVSPAVG